ncbi:MAG: methyltransferase domain-containing protein [Chlorobi bacterium]|nr:methyltransferase domain-containing protein [Chlorobiota bacterium]
MSSNKPIRLNDLSPQKLGKLFPVIIAKPNHEWKNIYDAEKNELIRILGKKAIRIEHFGSTAVPNLEAKPTIDILVEISNNEEIKEEIIKIMQSEGYHFIPRNDCPPPYLMFVKGYTNEGFKGQSYHIHMAEKEHDRLWDRLYFRDYLIDHKETASEYEKIKRKLAEKYKYDREAYTNGKTEFIKQVTEKSKIQKIYRMHCIDWNTNNPWLEISYSDYENHMIEVGQAQVLNRLTKYNLDKYNPESFALIGCSTGNGLEHIKPEITRIVYAVDINPYYLNKTRERFNTKIDNLQICNTDIQNDEIKIKNIDLVFIGLILEYVEPEKVLKKIIQILSKKGILSIVIQKNKQTSFVSKTNYTSLEKLTNISNEVNEEKIDRYIKSKNMELIKREEIELTRNKSFITLEYRMKQK